VVEVSASDMQQLQSVLLTIPGQTKVHIAEQTVQVHFPKGTANPEEVNQFCFNKGITLQQLSIKKKRLEERFFELTNN
jgi:ABC-2 type transport system ATP-binding protein